MSVSQIHVKMVALASMSLDPINVYVAADMWGRIVKVSRERKVDITKKVETISIGLADCLFYKCVSQYASDWAKVPLPDPIACQQQGIASDIITIRFVKF